MAVLDQEGVGDEHAPLVEHGQGGARQRGVPGVTQRLQAVLRGGQVAAVDDQAAVSGQPGVAAAHGVDQGGGLPGGVADEGLGDAGLGVLELLVEGLRGDGDVVIAGLAGGVDRRLDPQDDVGHEGGQRGEEQLILVLGPGVVAEELVDAIGVEHAPEGGLPHDRDRPFGQELLKNVAQDHQPSPRNQGDQGYVYQHTA